MLELYYSPIACSLAVHIALEEAELPHKLHLVSTNEGEHQQAPYLSINPLAKVPALRLDDGEVLTEVAALLCHIAGLCPDRHLLPMRGVEHTRAISWMSFLTSQVHPAFVTLYNPARYTTDQDAQAALQADGRLRFFEMLEHVERMLPEGGAVLAGQKSLVDGFAFVFYLWALKFEMPVHELAKYSALVARLLQRPAVLRALETEGLGELAVQVLSQLKRTEE